MTGRQRSNHVCDGTCLCHVTEGGCCPECSAPLTDHQDGSEEPLSCAGCGRTWADSPATNTVTDLYQNTDSTSDPREVLPNGNSPATHDEPVSGTTEDALEMLREVDPERHAEITGRQDDLAVSADACDEDKPNMVGHSRRWWLDAGRKDARARIDAILDDMVGSFDLFPGKRDQIRDRIYREGEQATNE